MKRLQILKIILGISVFGVLFSGVLSYQELFVPVVGASCPTIGASGTVFGYPACVYGFFMYATLVVFSVLGLRARD